MSSAEDIRNAKILIVDDKEADILLLVRTLEGAGYTRVSFMPHSVEVCDLHRMNNYDLILLDMEMPGMDGFEVIEGIKEVEGHGCLPVIVMSAYPKYQLRALQAGVRDFISKPFEISDLLARIHSLIEARLLYKEAKQYTQKLEGLLKEMGGNRHLETSN